MAKKKTTKKTAKKTAKKRSLAGSAGRAKGVQSKTVKRRNQRKKAAAKKRSAARSKPPVTVEAADITKPPERSGTGGISAESNDARLYQRAIRNRWPVDSQMKQDICEAMHGMIKRGRKPHLKIKAANVLMVAERQNQADEHLGERMPPPVPASQVNVLGNASITIDDRRDRIVDILTQELAKRKSTEGS